MKITSDTPRALDFAAKLKKKKKVGGRFTWKKGNVTPLS